MDKKDRILDSALKLFVEKGFHGTATSKIAQEAGVANGTLFQYFKTKDELVIALYIHVKEALEAYIAENTAKNGDMKGSIKSQVLSSLLWSLDNSIKFRFIRQFHTSPYLGQVSQEVLVRQAEPHLALIQKGIEQGVLKNLPIDLIYVLMSNHVFGLYDFITSRNLSKIKQKQIIEQTFEMLWDMLT